MSHSSTVWLAGLLPLSRGLARNIILVIIAACACGATPATASTLSTPDSSLTVPVVTAAGDQEYETVVPDGAGGAIVSWTDLRNGNAEIYAQHVLATHVVDPAWPVGGAPLTNDARVDYAPVATVDGAGGAIIAWEGSGNFAVRAQRVLSNGVPAWGAGITLASSSGFLKAPRICSDRAGGAFVVWQDDRVDPASSGQLDAQTDVYAAHLLPTGLDPTWPVSGFPVCTAAGAQIIPRICTDGGTGALVVWRDTRTPANSTDIYAQHLNVDATLDPAWPATGAAVSTRPTNQHFNRSAPGFGILLEGTGEFQGDNVVPDGSGGCLVAWEDGTTPLDLYMQHLRNDGTVDPAWTAGGNAICTEAGPQGLPKMLPDGSGGALVTWQDGRHGIRSNSYGIWGEIYVQHVLGNGVVAGPATGLQVTSGGPVASTPQVVSDGVGGMLLFWEDIRDSTTSASDVYVTHMLPSPLAVDASWPAEGYPLCRRVGDQRTVMPIATDLGGAITGWMNWDHLATSGPPVPTEIDIYAGFVVGDAVTAALAEFAARPRGAGIEVRWQFADPVRFADLRLERADAAVGPWTTLDDAIVSVADETTVAWDRHVVEGRTYFYRLVATGPQGQATFGPVAATAGTTVAEFAIASIAPNPTPARSTIAYTLPRAADVELSVVDVQGRVVAMLANASEVAGRHEAVWSGRTDRGEVLPGLYFVRLRTTAGTAVRRLVIAP